MSGKGLCVAVLAVATILAVPAAGQDEKSEVGGPLGRNSFISDQGIQGGTFSDSMIHCGKGLTIGGEYARRFWVAPVYSILLPRP